MSHASIPEGVDPKSADLLRRAYTLDNPDDGQQLYREWATSYDATMLDGLGYLSPRLVVGLAAELRAMVRGPVLDIGCGTGLLGDELARHGFDEFDGIDLSPEMLDVARQRGVYRSLVEADLLGRLPLDDAAYGGAVCAGMFTSGHVGAACLAELLRVMAPGALFVCTVHHAVRGELGFDEAFERLTTTGALREVVRREVGFYDNTDADGYLYAFEVLGPRG